MSTVTLHPGDNRETLRRLIDEGVRVHSIVTDPPYGLVSVQKRFGKEGSAAARTEGNDGSFNRLSGGFMGKTWDGTDIERDPEFWRLIYDILLPGGYCFAFSGSRTGHWQAVAMETAGFIMHPMHGWCFGSGFPKAHAARGAGEEWEGWAYGTQSQKPALEPIYLGQKPFSEKTGAANLLKHGVGAVNIDGCRVPLAADDALHAGVQHAERKLDTADNEGKWGFKAVDRAAGLGRHPANLILDGSPEVVAMFPESKSSGGKGAASQKTALNGEVYGTYSGATLGKNAGGLGDSGSAARFFHQFPRYACEECQDSGMVYTPMHCIGDSPTYEPCECGGSLEPTDPLFYHPKAGKLDRAGSRHPTVKPIALMQYLIRHITPPGGVVLDPFAGSGTTGEAAQREGFDCILMEAEAEYVEFLESRFSLTDRQEPAVSDTAYLQLLGFDLP